MHTTLSTLVLVSGAMLAALLVTISMTGAFHFIARREHGFMHFIFYAMLFAVAAGSLLSGRDMTSHFQIEETAAKSVIHPLMTVLQPLTSLLILAVCGERIIAHGLQRRTAQPPWLLLIAFLVFWACTVAAPALFGAHPQLSHDDVYPLVIGIAATMASGLERDQALKAARDAIFIFMLSGLLLVAVSPSLVLDHAYTQGLIPGLPRLAGLSSHPVGMGLLSQLGLLCLMARPYRRPWLQRLAWTVGLTSLFVAQSKTAWLAFLICGGTLLAVQQGPVWWRRMTDPIRPAVGMTVMVGFMLSVLTLVAVLIFGNLGDRLDTFINTPEGAQLTSLTGRDRIWAIAFDEWQRNPVFGYGPAIWGDAFRTSIGMANATHGHNQFMDTLSRAGTVGVAGLTLYSLLLLALSMRWARATQGLSLALFLALMLRAISEVPLLMFGYSTEMFIHVLLLLVLAAASQETRPEKPLSPTGPEASKRPRSPTHPSSPLHRPPGGPLVTARHSV
jgi:O-antigen ligase